MKFIIMLLPTEELPCGNGKVIQKNMFNSGLTPILGPISDEDFESVLSSLKEKTNDNKVVFVSIEGTIC